MTHLPPRRRPCLDALPVHPDLVCDQFVGGGGDACVGHGRSGRSFSCCGMESTYDESVAPCTQLGSPFAEVFIALSGTLEATPVRVAWQCVRRGDAITPPDSSLQSFLLLDSKDTMPIEGLVPLSQMNRTDACVLCVQRVGVADFDIFFLFWSEYDGFAFLNSGSSWRVDGSGRLQASGRPLLSVKHMRCNQLAATDAKLLHTPWLCRIRIQPSRNPEGAARVDKRWMYRWIKGVKS